MNRDLFLRHIEKTRDCRQDNLDYAVKKGLHRAMNDRIDPKKMLMLAAACVIVFTMCFTLNMEPLREAADRYYRNLDYAMPGSSQALYGYIDNITEIIINFIGGE